MGVFDKFLDIMKLNDDDDEYDDDLYDDEEYDDEGADEKPRRSFFGRKSKDDFEDYDNGSSRSANRFAPKDNKVMPIRRAAARKNAGMEVCVVKPSSVEDSRDITLTLLSGRTVILNLEGMDLEVAQRIIDFISGAAFAIDGNLQKISNYIFLVTPTNVDITGDLQDLLGGSMESANVKRRF